MVWSPVLRPPNERFYSFTPAQSRPSSLISSSEPNGVEKRLQRLRNRDQGGCRGSHSYNCRTGGVMGKGRVKSARWARAVAARELRRWPRDGDASSRTIHHGKLGKIGEGHGIFGWPLWLRHVRPITPRDHLGYVTPADRPSYTHIFICLVCWSLTGKCFHSYVFLRDYTFV